MIVLMLCVNPPSLLGPRRNEPRLRRQRDMIALLAAKGRFISPRGVCFSTIRFISPKECREATYKAFYLMQLTMPSEPASAVNTAINTLSTLLQLICFDMIRVF